VHDLGDIEVTRPDADQTGNRSLKFLPQVRKTNEQLAKVVANEVKMGRFPLVLGGDHSIAIGTIAGCVQQRKKLGVIWFDAHGDLNTEKTTPSGNIHGMPLAVCLGFGHPDLVAIGGDYAKIQPDKVVIIGARSLDEGEKTLIREKGIRVFTMHDIDRLGMAEVMERALMIVTEGTDGVHLSLDVDGIDPLYAPGVGTPVIGGITYREGHLAMEMIAEADILTSAEIVEVNPILDQQNATAHVVCTLILSALGETLL
jgi:arginase